ncbi:MAG: TVP38/TMEM64 family protein [Nannocystales bacterium]
MTRRVPVPVLWTALFAAILVPFALWGDAFEAYGASLLDSATPSASLALILIALLAGDLVLPIPSSLLAVGVGAVFGTAAGATIITLGLSFGGWVGYELGRSAGRAGVSRWVDDAQRQRLEAFGEKHGLALLVALRAVPVLAEASVLVAGTSGMPRMRVLAATTLANLAIALVYAAAGSIASDLGSLELAAMAGVGLPGIAMLLSARLRPRAG